MGPDRWHAVSADGRAMVDALVRTNRRLDAIRVVRDALACDAREARTIVAERTQELLGPKPKPTAEEVRSLVAERMATYDRAVARVLRLTPLDARRAWRVVFRPSFHVECAVEVIAGSGLRVVTPSRQIWAWTQGAGHPRVGWVEPAVADEHVAVATEEVASLGEALERLVLRADPSKDLLLDGMPATLTRCTTERSETIEWNLSSPTEEGAALVRFGQAMHAFAIERVRWEASRGALDDLGRYFPR